MKEYTDRIDNVQEIIENLERYFYELNDTIDHIRMNPDSDKEALERARGWYWNIDGVVKDYLLNLAEELDIH